MSASMGQRSSEAGYFPAPGLSAVLLGLILLLGLPLPAKACRWAGLVADTPAGNVLFVFRGLEPRPHLIRLTGIACPGPDQPWGARARILTAGLLGRRVTVLAGLSLGPEEVGAQVFTPQGRDLGLELLKLGLARCSEGPGPAGYQEAQEEARRAGLGLWGGAQAGLP